GSGCESHTQVTVGLGPEQIVNGSHASLLRMKILDDLVRAYRRHLRASAKRQRSDDSRDSAALSRITVGETTRKIASKRRPRHGCTFAGGLAATLFVRTFRLARKDF